MSRQTLCHDVVDTQGVCGFQQESSFSALLTSCWRLHRVDGFIQRGLLGWGDIKLWFVISHNGVRPSVALTAQQDTQRICTGFIQCNREATAHYSYVPISRLNTTIRLVLCRSICSLNYQSVDCTYCLYFWPLKRSSLIFTFPVTGDIVVAGWYTLSLSQYLKAWTDEWLKYLSSNEFLEYISLSWREKGHIMAPITFMASTNRETRDRGRHRAEVVRSNIKVTTQTRSTQSCSDAEWKCRSAITSAYW